MPMLPDQSGPGSRALSAISNCIQAIGKPYVWGAGGPNSFDCSGLMYWAYHKYHVPEGEETKHRWTTATIKFLGDPVSHHEGQPGDLVMPHSGHVGIVVAPGRMIDAPTRGIPVGLRAYNPNDLYAIRRVATPANQDTVSGMISLLAEGNVFSDIGEAVGGAFNAVDKTLSTIDAVLDSTGHVLGWLGVTHNWLRIAQVVGGGVSVVFAARLIGERIT